MENMTSNPARPLRVLDAMAEAMGRDVLSREEILERLRVRGWAPGASNPLCYLALLATENPEIFEQVGQRFRVKDASAVRKRLQSPTVVELACSRNSSGEHEAPAIGAAGEPLRAAERWRAMFMALLQVTDSPGDLHQSLLSGLRERLWVNLHDRSGKRFRTFEAFCAEAPPFGLGADPAHVQRALARLVGPREADLLVFAPARQGVRGGLPANTGGKSIRQTERLRAVQERAPESIRHLYTLGVLPLAAAARYGLANPTEAQVAEVERASVAAMELVRKLGETPSEAELKAARSEAEALLPARHSRHGQASRLMEQCRALPSDEREAFIRLFQAWIHDLEHQGPADDPQGLQ